MKTAEQLEAEIRTASALLRKREEVRLLEDEILRGSFPHLKFSLSGLSLEGGGKFFEQALIHTLNKWKAELREAGVEVGQDLYYPGVTFTGALGDGGQTVTFSPGTAPAVVDGISTIKASNGSWELEKDGQITFNTKPYQVAATENESGDVYRARVRLSDAVITDAHISPVLVQDPALVARVQSLEGQVSGLSNQLNVASAQSASQPVHWNKPEDLPPVGCTLLIKVPAGTKVVTAGKEDAPHMGYNTDEDLVFNVFRVSHLSDRAGDMEYRLPDNSTVTGRFEWTYP